MRYSLTLPLALAALATAPAFAQDANPTESAPPATTVEPVAPTPPADETVTPPAPVETTAPPAPTDEATPPAEPATAPVPVTPAPEATAPAPAPATTPAPLPAPTMTAEQKAAYDAWPAETKTYFGGLTPARQALFLRIADADKAKILALTVAQREQVWVSLEKQDAEQKAAAPKK